MGSECDFFYRKSCAACWAEVMNDSCSQPEASRQQGCTARRAHRCANVKIGEPHPAGGERVEVGREIWRRELGIPRTGVPGPICSHISVSPVIPVAGHEASVTKLVRGLVTVRHLKLDSPTPSRSTPNPRTANQNCQGTDDEPVVTNWSALLGECGAKVRHSCAPE